MESTGVHWSSLEFTGIRGAGESIALMADGGPENDNKDLRAACESNGTELLILPAYSPWINRLLEGMNGKLLGRLKRLCAPDLGEVYFTVPHRLQLEYGILMGKYGYSS